MTWTSQKSFIYLYVSIMRIFFGGRGDLQNHSYLIKPCLLIAVSPLYNERHYKVTEIFSINQILKKKNLDLSFLEGVIDKSYGHFCPLTICWPFYYIRLMWQYRQLENFPPCLVHMIYEWPLTITCVFIWQFFKS